MADTILTLQQIENLFQAQTTKMLGYSTTPINGVPQNQDKVRIAWEPVGAPAWERTEDICFLQVTTDDDDYSKKRDITYSGIDESSGDKITCYTRVLKIRWTLYGPNSYDRAETIKNSLFDSDYVKSFKDNNLFLVLDFKPPVRVPELYNAQWWDRTDFEVSYNEKITRRATVPFIQSANITITKG